MSITNEDISAVVPCVNYADILSITLPRMIMHFPNITILTSAHDKETIRLAAKHGVSTLISNRWHKNGASFSKSSAVNEWMFRINHNDCKWRLTLDADILFPEMIQNLTERLDDRGLYSVRRRMCDSPKELQMLRAGQKGWEDFPVHIPKVKNGTVWGGKRRTRNPVAICGYFQLWHSVHCAGKKYFPYSPNAAGYDVDFALSFPEHMRSFIEGIDVLHLGSPIANWDGRMTPSWKEH